METQAALLLSSSEHFRCDNHEGGPKFFLTRGRYNQHLKTHTKPFECGSCDKRFALRHDLDRHAKARHRTGNARYPCKVLGCIFRATRKDNVRQHMLKVHDKGLELKEELDNKCIKASDRHGILGEPKALLQAAGSGNIRMVQYLLAAGVEVATKGDDGSTALHCAARTGHVEIVEELIRAKISLTEKNDMSRTALQEAVEGGHTRVVILLLQPDIPGQGRICQNNHGDLSIKNATALNSWPWSGQIAAVYREWRRSYITEGNRPLLHHAASLGHKFVVQALLSVPNVNANQVSTAGWTSLHHAVRNGHDAVVETILMQEGIDVNPKIGRQGFTPLHIAIKHNYIRIIKLLLATNKVEINIVSFGRTPIQFAAERGQAHIVRLLLADERIDTTDWKENWRFQCPLESAIKGGKTDVVQLLLDDGRVDIKGEWRRGETSLHIAATHGHVEVVQLLLELDIDINARASGLHWTPELEHRTALDYARFKGHEEIVSLLLAHGAIDEPYQEQVQAHSTVVSSDEMDEETSEGAREMEHPRDQEQQTMDWSWQQYPWPDEDMEDGNSDDFESSVHDT